MATSSMLNLKRFVKTTSVDQGGLNAQVCDTLNAVRIPAEVGIRFFLNRLPGYRQQEALCQSVITMKC